MYMDEILQRKERHVSYVLLSARHNIFRLDIKLQHETLVKHKNYMNKVQEQMP